MFALIAAFGGLVGCGDDGGTPADGGPGDADMSDADQADTGVMDAGTDSGTDGQDAGTDAGVQGCTEGCSFVQVQAGFGHTCALRENGTVLCWGQNSGGELGDGRERHGGAGCTPAGVVEPRDCTAIPQEVVDLPPADAISTRGGQSTCALADNAAYCWGLEAFPESSSMQSRERFRPEEMTDFGEVMEVADQRNFTCALQTDGTAMCLGEGEGGQLGNGDTLRTLDPVDVMGLMGATDIEVAIGGSFFGSQGEFACARAADDTLCWGTNEFGQLGIGNRENSNCGNEIDRRDCVTSPVSLGRDDFAQLSLGIEHACAVTTEGALECWGQNQAGQLGIAESDLELSPTPMGLTDVAKVSAGGFFTCALMNDGVVKCWGANEEGQLGDGSFDHGQTCGIGGDTGDCESDAVDVDLPETAVDVAAGYAHACAVTETNEVYCWGWNDRRQLGEEDREPRATPVFVEGLE
jgi:alpha-tubulin suppressor-like RCC1 family protein